MSIWNVVGLVCETVEADGPKEAQEKLNMALRTRGFNVYAAHREIVDSLAPFESEDDVEASL